MKNVEFQTVDAVSLVFVYNIYNFWFNYQFFTIMSLHFGGMVEPNFVQKIELLLSLDDLRSGKFEKNYVKLTKILKNEKFNLTEKRYFVKSTL